MTQRVVILPAWVVPSAVAVDDLYWLAQCEEEPRHGDDWVGGVVGAVMWVTWDAMVGPVTGRPEQPVTAAVARAEVWAAAAASDGGATPEWRLKAACVELGVRYYPPALDVVGVERGYGVYQTLSWLLCDLDGYGGGRVAPVRLPVRGADGVTVTAEELYGQAMLTEPHLWHRPETQPMLRDRVEADAQEYRRLVGLIEDTKRRAGAV